MITPDKFLLLAKRIVSDPKISEEEARTAISRAYYSLYHETLELMIKKYSLDLIAEIEKEWGKKLNAHERIQLNNLDPVFLSQVNFHRVMPNVIRRMHNPIIATVYINYREKRNQADYDLKLSPAYSDADTIVSNIDRFIVIVKAL